MKLDKIKFARLTVHIQALINYRKTELSVNDIEDVDALIDVEMPDPVHMLYASTDDVNDLIALMSKGTHKIEAIKLHRKLTGWGLKESKDEVEKHWPKLSSHYVPPTNEPSTAFTSAINNPKNKLDMNN